MAIRNKEMKKWVSLAMSGAMLATTIMPAPMAFAAEKNPTELDVSKGNIVISDNSVSGFNKYGDEVKVTNPDGYTIVGKSAVNTIKINSGTQSIVFNGLELTTESDSPVYVAPSAKANITLQGENTIKNMSTASEKAAINVPSSATVNFNGTGTLNAETAGYGAAIGGNGDADGTEEQGAGTINAEEGTILAKAVNNAIGSGVDKNNTADATEGTLDATSDSTAWVEASKIDRMNMETFDGGVLINEAGTTDYVTVNTAAILNKNLSIGAGKTLTVKGSLTLAKDVTLTVEEEGKVAIIGAGSIIGEGKFENKKKDATNIDIKDAKLTNADLHFASELVYPDAGKVFPNKLKEGELKRGLVNLPVNENIELSYSKKNSRDPINPDDPLTAGDYKIKAKITVDPVASTFYELSKDFTVKLATTDVEATPSTTDWANSVTLTAPEGYEISLDDVDKNYGATVELSAKKGNISKQGVQDVKYFIRDKKPATPPKDYVQHVYEKTVKLKLDTEVPTISEIAEPEELKNNDFKITVTNAADTNSGVAKYYVLPVEGQANTEIKPNVLGKLSAEEYVKANGIASDKNVITVNAPKANQDYNFHVVVEDKAGNLSTVNKEKTIKTEQAAFVGTVTISGSVMVGETLTATPNITSPANPGTLTYEWHRVSGNVDETISGATNAKYQVTGHDKGYSLYVIVKSNNAVDNSAIKSDLTSVVNHIQLDTNAFPSLTAETPVDGTVQVGFNAENKEASKAALIKYISDLQAKKDVVKDSPEDRVLKAIESGKVVKAKVVPTKATPSESAKAAFEALAKEKVDTGILGMMAFENLDLQINIGEKDPVNIVDLLGNNLEMTAKLPVSKDGTKYGIMRYIDGKAEVVDSTYDSTANRISFKADKLGQYAVYAYTEANFTVISDVIEDQIFTGEEIKPEIAKIVDSEGKEIAINAENFDITYANNKEIGKATITITGKGSYRGTKVIEFNIVAPSVATIGEIASQHYTGEEIKPEIVVKDTQGNVVDASKYDVTYENNKMPGTATIIIEGKDGYTGKITAEFQIEKPAFDRVIAIDDIVETGEAIIPEINLVNTWGDRLVEGVDYEVRLLNNIEVGEAFVVIDGIGAYEGEKIDASFNIVSKKPATIVSSSIKAKTDAGLIRVYFSTPSVPGKDMSYRVAYKRVGKNYKWQYKVVHGNYATLRNLVKNGKYQIKVRAFYKEDGKEVLGNYSNSVYKYANRYGTKSAKLPAAKVLKVSTNGKTTSVTAKTIKFKKAPYKVNYQFAYKLANSKKWHYSKVTKSNKIAFKNLQKGKKYVFATRYSYKSAVDGKTLIKSPYSYRTVTIKK